MERQLQPGDAKSRGNARLYRPDMRPGSSLRKAPHTMLPLADAFLHLAQTRWPSLILSLDLKKPCRVAVLVSSMFGALLQHALLWGR